MSKENTRSLKLGIFVITGTVLLITALYLIGSKRNLFSNTVTISATFYNVNGLMPGNNVRYSGIDVGTVDKIMITNDTAIIVRMVIEKKIRPFIKKNAVASIGTDGLMGNKLVNINSVSEQAQAIEEGDMLISLRPVETDEMVRTLNQTNNNLATITSDIKNLTQKFNRKNNVFHILTDTVTAENIRDAFREFRSAAQNADEITQRVNSVVMDIQQGDGVIGSLVYDTAAADKIGYIITNLQHISDSIGLIASQLNTFSRNLNDPGGLAYSLLKDSVMTTDVRQTLNNINQSAAKLNENMKAMQRNFLFRKYFKEKEKADKKK